MNAHTHTELITQTNQSLTPVKTNTLHPGIFPKPLRLAGGLLLLALSASLVAQTHFCVAGDLDHMSPANVAACEARMSGVRDAAKQRGVPAGWHFVVVCDEAGWKQYRSFSRGEAGMLTGAGYSTDPRLRWTFLRGSEMSVDQPAAAAEIVSMALEGVPNQKSAPQVAMPIKTRRQFDTAMAAQGSVSPDSQ